MQAQVSPHSSLGDALTATAQDPFVIVAGSLYLVGEAMELLHLSPAKATPERGLNEWGSATPPAPSVAPAVQNT